MEFDMATPNAEAKEGDGTRSFIVEGLAIVKTLFPPYASSIAREITRLITERLETSELCEDIDQLKATGVCENSSVFVSIDKHSFTRGQRGIVVTIGLESTYEQVERLAHWLDSTLAGLHSVYRGILYTGVDVRDMTNLVNELQGMLQLLMATDSTEAQDKDAPLDANSA